MGALQKQSFSLIIAHKALSGRIGRTTLAEGRTIVVDIGKTLAKVSVWSAAGECLDRMTRPNERPAKAEYATLDIDGTTAWVLKALESFAHHPIGAIIPVSHGAAIVGLRDNRLAFAPPDYEWAMPEEAMAAYRKERDRFAETGSPALPAGLNLGAQLHFLDETGALEGATLLPYAQYWAWLLSGVAISEVTSIGCHTDLWAPTTGGFSTMAKRRGWAERFAPLASAGEVIGTLRPEIARATGLSPKVGIHAGLHDSNAALVAARGFAEIEDNEATVLSTGTWFISMRLAKVGADSAALPEARDCLVNVDAYGQPVPSARFMGGREIETLIEIDTRQVDIKPDQSKLLDAVPGLTAEGAMVLPTLAPGTGPFPDSDGGWVRRPEDWYARRAGACLYAALVADTSLDLIGSKDRLLVEGRFSEAEVVVRALAALRPDTQVFVANAHNDVSLGALRLIDPSLRPQGELRQVQPLEVDLTTYREEWASACKVLA